MKTVLKHLAAVMVTLVFSLTPTLAQETTVVLDDVVVSGQIVAPTREALETVYTGVELTREGLKLGGEKASHSVWEAVSILPGIMFTSPDPYNLASTQSSIRVRGVSGSLGSMSIEGIPIYGGNPIGPRTYILDLDNFDSLAVYKGAVPADLGPGAGTRGGTLQLRPRWASDTMGASFQQSYGSFDYMKSFIRFDSGQLGPAGSKLSLAYSYAKADKWRGEGEVGPRNNVNLTFVQPLGDKLEVKLWGNFNSIKHHQYRSLTWAQAQNLDEFRKFDFTTSLTGNPATDWQYYDFNKNEWTSYDLYAYIDYRLTDTVKFTLKPFYRQEKKEDWAGTGRLLGPSGSRPGVQESGWTTRRWGGMVEASADLQHIRGLVGFQYEESKSIDSQASNYWLNPDGSFQFVGWGRYVESQAPSYRYSPYARLSGTAGAFNWQTGLKYLKLKEADNQGYLTQFDSAGNPYLEREPRMDYGSREYDAWLPTAGLSYFITDNAEVYGSYGKTFQQPYRYMPLINMYYALHDKFTKMGMTLEDLFQEYKPEETDNVDIGFRFRSRFLEVNPTVFLSKHKNLNTPITPGWEDPDAPGEPLLFQGRPASYNTFVGKANGYGFEVGTNVILSENLTFFFNPAYTRLEYDGNIVSGGVVFDTDGKQVVDVPEWTLTSGLVARYKGIEAVPIIRYIGKRYGDMLHQEILPSYTVVDLKLGYTLDKINYVKDLTFSVGMYNLFNKTYIASTSYHPGTPFTAVGSVSFRF